MPYRTVITTDQLAAAPDELVVVDCRYDLADSHRGRELYAEAHIPGAVYASLSEDLSATPTGQNGRHPLPDVNAMAVLFGRLGISAGKQVVAYDQDNGMFASRLWWMLRYLGHDATAVLDGGFAKWVREGRPTRGGIEQPRPAAFQPAVRQMWTLSVDEIEEIVRTDAALLVDARSPERFEGRHETLDRAAGHIPGAVNHFFRENVATDGTLRPAADLTTAFSRTLGGRRPEEVVMYCGSGVTACQNLLALEHAGIKGVRLFPGSWSEWSATASRPIETGPSRRKPPAG